MLRSDVETNKDFNKGKDIISMCFLEFIPYSVNTLITQIHLKEKNGYYT